MGTLHFDHIGIVCLDINIGEESLKSLIDISRTSRIIEDVSLGVRIKFLYDNSNICYELIAPLGPNSPVKRVLSSKENILNHIAYRTDNFDIACEKLREEGNFPITEAKKAKAFNNKRVRFYLSKLDFIFEIIEC